MNDLHIEPLPNIDELDEKILKLITKNARIQRCIL